MTPAADARKLREKLDKARSDVWGTDDWVRLSKVDAAEISRALAALEREQDQSSLIDDVTRLRQTWAENHPSQPAAGIVAEIEEILRRDPTWGILKRAGDEIVHLNNVARITVETAKREIAALEREKAELAKDAERLDWLEIHAKYPCAW